MSVQLKKVPIMGKPVIRMLPGTGHDSTAQCDKLSDPIWMSCPYIGYLAIFLFTRTG